MATKQPATVISAAQGPDRFNGVSVVVQGDLARLEPVAFQEQLQDAIKQWRGKGIRGVWITFPLAAARLISVAVDLGFSFHHCMPDFAVLTAWLPDTACTLPNQPHHQVGVGGFVLNRRREVLVIQERSGLTAGMKDFWKLPGGLVDPNEALADAVVREVHEETGLRVRFGSIAAIRESHSGTYGGMTDLYCVCVCLLDTDAHGEDDAPTPVPQEHEIAACRWMPADELFSLPFYRRRSVYSDLLRHGLSAAETALARGTSSGTISLPVGISLVQRDRMRRSQHTGALYAASRL